MWAELWAAKKSAHKKNVGAKKKKYGRNAVYRWTKSDHMKKVGAQKKKCGQSPQFTIPNFCAHNFN